MQTPISIPAIEAEYITPLQAPLTELQFNTILHAISNGLDSLMITDQFTIKASDMFELLEMNEQFYKSATGSFMFGMNMDCGYPILSYKDYVEYWSNYYQPLTEEEHYKVIDNLEYGMLPEGVLPDWLRKQAVDTETTPNSIYSYDWDGDQYLGSWVMGNYEIYLKRCNEKIAKYKEQFVREQV